MDLTPEAHERMPVIGVPLRPWQRTGKPRRLMQDRIVFDLVTDAGGVAMALPPLPAPQLRRLYALCDGLLLPGGRDMDPRSYGVAAPPELAIESHPELDAAELQLVAWAARERRPLFGICRGAQVLNVAMGGNLWLDLERDGQCAAKTHGGAGQLEPAGSRSHEVTIASPSWLHAVIRERNVVTNSRHHQAVRVLGGGLRAVARAADGVVEAIEAIDGGWLACAVQWHPEDMHVDHPAGPALVRAFVAAIVRNRTQPADGDRPSGGSAAAGVAPGIVVSA